MIINIIFYQITHYLYGHLTQKHLLHVNVIAGVCDKLDIVLILDYSGSISFVGGWNDMKAFSQLLVQQFNLSPDTYITILTFSRYSELRVSESKNP